MNFKDWQKLEANDKTVTLKHPKGHQMTIALKGLPKIQQEMLKRLKFAKGGEVDDSDDMSEQGKTVRHAKKMKDRGESIDKEMVEAKDEAKGRAEFERKAVKPKMKGLAQGGRVSYDEGTPDRPVSQDDQAQPAAPAAPVVVNVQAPQAPAIQSPPASFNPAAQQAEVPIAPKVPVVPEGLPNTNSDGTMNPAAVAKNAQAAVKAKTDIEDSTAQASVAPNQAYIKGLADIESQKQADLANVTKHVDDMKNYITDPKTAFNPNHYQESMSAGRKTATALGLFLGGMGTPFGGQNYAMDFLNKQIDRDIHAQEVRSDQQKTLLGAYQSIYGDTVAARNATKASMLDIRNAQANQIAAQLGTPMARQRALELGNATAIEKSKLLQDAAVSLSSLPGNRGGGSGPVQSKDPAAQPEKTHPLQGSLLHHGAEQAFQALQYTPKAKDQLPEITRQFTQAQQADKALAQVNNTFMNLITGAQNGGVGGRIHRTMDPHALPGSGMVGDAVKAVGYLGQQASNTDTNRLYDSQQSELKGYISSALKGTNIGSTDIDDIVSKNSPEYGDSRETQARKLKTIRDFIKNHTETSLLKTWHLTDE